MTYFCLYGHSFQIFHRIVVQHQICIFSWSVINQPVQLRAVIHIVGDFVLCGDGTNENYAANFLTAFVFNKSSVVMNPLPKYCFPHSAPIPHQFVMKVYVNAWIYVTEKFVNRGNIELYEEILRYEKADYPPIPNFISIFPCPESLDLIGFPPFSGFGLHPFYTLLPESMGVRGHGWWI